MFFQTYYVFTIYYFLARRIKFHIYTTSTFAFVIIIRFRDYVFNLLAAKNEFWITSREPNRMYVIHHIMYIIYVCDV